MVMELKLGKVFRIFILIMFLAVANALVAIKPDSSNNMVYAEHSSSSDQDWPLVYVYPENVSTDVGETFDVSIVICNLRDETIPDPDWPTELRSLGNLYGLDVQLSWDPNILNYVNHIVTIPWNDSQTPIPPSPYAGILYSPGMQVKDVVDEDGGISGAEPETMGWWSYASMDPAPKFNGNGTVCTITFEVLRGGASDLELVSVELPDIDGKPILCRKQNGYFESPGAPLARFTFWPDTGVVDKPVIFNASLSADPDGYIVEYIWDFGDQNITTVSNPVVNHSYGSAGIYTASLIAVDNEGVNSSRVEKIVEVVESRNVKVTSVSLSTQRILVNGTVGIDVYVENEGVVNERFTLSVYYNNSATSWNMIDRKNVSIPKEGWKVVSFNWSTTGVPKLEAYYYVLANATLVPYEKAADNTRKSGESVFITEEEKHDAVIDKLVFGWAREAGLAVILPVIKGESTTIRITVWNNGTGPDGIRVTLYGNGSILKSWNETLQVGEKWARVLETSKQLDPGYHNLTALAMVGDDENPMNSRMEGILHVIETPLLAISYSPEELFVNETVTFDASATIHGDPGGIITEYTWEFRLGVTPEKIVTVYQPTVNYTFEGKGNWTVALRVKDNYGIEYATGAISRVATRPYQKTITVEVQEKAPPPGPVFPFEYLVIVIVIVVIGLAAFVLYRRRRARS